MIILHKINGDEFVLNADHIELIEEKPDTTITLANDKIFIVMEKKEEVMKLALVYYYKIHNGERFKESNNS